MDKYEYKIRADEIKTLIAQGDYGQAAEIADTIDWRRVKSVMMLCTISDLYKINRRYEDAKNMLFLAYERRPGGRTICYSLCELCIKMEDVVQALKYYKEFVQVAPKDTGRYILQYKIYEAQDVSLEERIGVLEEMKKRDYREKWAYELAYLYHRMGLATRCVEECDELILWFGDGKYVVKAMELKMLHQPLTLAQQEIYDRRFEELSEEADQGDGDSGIYEDSADYGQQADMGQEAYGWASEDGQFMGDGQEDGQAGYEGDFRQMEGEPAREVDGMPPGEMDEGSSTSSDDMDIHVKTMDVGKYNTINLQAELAAGLQEVLGAEEAAYFGQEAGGQQEADIVQEQGGSKGFAPEEMEGSEVFFGATGEMEDMPWEAGRKPGQEEGIHGMGSARMPDVEGAGLTGGAPEGALSSGAKPEEHGGQQQWKPAGQQEDVVEFARRQPEAEEASEGQIRERQPGEADTAGRHDVIDFAERQLAVERQRETANAAGELPAGQQSAAADAVERQNSQGRTPEPADLAVQAESQEGSPVDQTARQVMEQLRSETEQSEGRQHEDGQLPGELAEVLSQEANGQISLVLPESAAIEKQITGQMKIDDILIEWERMKKENEEKCREEVRKHILHQTGPMFTEFEAAIRDGLLEKLEKEAEAKAKNGTKEQAPGGEGQVVKKQPQSQAEGREGEAAGAPSGDNAGTVPETGRQQTGFGEGIDSESEQRAFEAGVGTTGIAGLADAGKSGSAGYIKETGSGDGLRQGEEPVSEIRPEYMEEGDSEENTAYEDRPRVDDMSVYGADSDFGQVPEGSGFDAVSGKAEEPEGEDAVDFDGGLAYEDETYYEEDSHFGQASGDSRYDAAAKEVGGLVGQDGMGFKETLAYEEDFGYGEDSGYEDSGYEGEPGYEGESGYESPLSHGADIGYEGGSGYEEEAGYTEESGAWEVTEEEDDPGYLEEYGAGEAVGYEGERAASDYGDGEEAGLEDMAEDDWEAESYETGDEIQEADIMDEIEGQQEQDGKADKRPKPARLKKQKPAEASEIEGLPVERDQAKVRSLSREEKELFAPFIQSRHSKEQLIQAIDSLSMAAYTGNLIITGEEGMDMLTLAKNIIRDVRVTDSNFSGKVAKITGQGLNDRKIEDTLEQLNNGALIIEAASGMRPETAAKLHRSLQQERVGIIVVMEDTKKAMKKLLLGTPDLYGDFPARIDLEALSNDTLVSFGKQYAREMEYSIDDLGMLALHTRIEELQTIDHVVTVAEVKQIVDEAIHHASRKTLGHFFDVLLARRYDDEDMVILTEKDFVA